MILPVIPTGLPIHRSRTIFICLLNIAGHVQVLGLYGKRKECRPDYRKKKYASAHKNPLEEEDIKKGFVTNFYLMTGK
jgi:hypothetical protein